ncbi:MAG: DUF3990 domain-containing protein [Clostridiales bacterium]|nr:DUF3990 domain-containing protein [Clostridiales bacterium]
MDYLVNQDIESAMIILELTQDEYARELGISRMTLNNWLSGRNKITEGNISNFYETVFDKGIRFNKIKEQLYKEELKSPDEVLLFHGAKTEIEGELSLECNKKINDFGKGFYCGESLEQSAMFVASYPESSLYMLKFNRKGLKCVEYDVDRDWMLMVAYYRGRLTGYEDNKIIRDLIRARDKADYIIAPIADNRMYETIDSFINGEITDIQCRHCLSATDLGRQYVMLTQQALDNTTLLEKCYLSDAEKKMYIGSKQEAFRVNQDKVKLARKQYRNQGNYIEDILK